MVRIMSFRVTRLAFAVCLLVSAGCHQAAPREGAAPAKAEDAPPAWITDPAPPEAKGRLFVVGSCRADHGMVVAIADAIAELNEKLDARLDAEVTMKDISGSGREGSESQTTVRCGIRIGAIRCYSQLETFSRAVGDVKESATFSDLLVTRKILDLVYGGVSKGLSLTFADFSSASLEDRSKVENLAFAHGTSRNCSARTLLEELKRTGVDVFLHQTRDEVYVGLAVDLETAKGFPVDRPADLEVWEEENGVDATVIEARDCFLETTQDIERGVRESSSAEKATIK